MVCMFVSPQIPMLKAHLQCDGQEGALWELSRHEAGAPMSGISALMKQSPDSSLAPPTVRAHGEAGPLRPGSGPSEDTTCAGTLTLDFPAPSTVRTQFLLFTKHPACAICYHSLKGLR